MKTVYEIKMTNQSIGVFLKSEKLAKEYMQKFVPEDCREDYFVHEIKEEKSLPADAIVCGSLEELMQKKPEQEIERLWVIRGQLQRSQQKLPCKLAIYIPKRQKSDNFADELSTSYTDYGMNQKVVDKLGYYDLKNLLKAAKYCFDVKKQMCLTAFTFSEFAGEKTLLGKIMVELSPAQYQSLKKFYCDIEKKIEETTARIEFLEAQIENKEEEKPLA